MRMVRRRLKAEQHDALHSNLAHGIAMMAIRSAQ
jgi:hypothetical protein